MLSKFAVCATLPFDGLKKAKDFYSKKVGLRVAGGSVRMGWLEFAAGKRTVLEVFESDSKKSEDTAATFHVDDLEKEMKALRKKGVTFEEYDLPGIKTVDGVATMGKTKGAWFKDPGGNVIAVVESP